MQLASYDPSNNELVGQVTVASEQDVTQAITIAKQAQQAWQDLSADVRLQYIRQAYDRLQPHIDKLAMLISQEMGKDLHRATAEARGTAFSGPYYAEQAMAAFAPEQLDARTQVQYRALGVTAVISPWNYPLAMANNLLIPALMAGNTVILKPSEQTPLVADLFVSILNQTLPTGVLQVVHGDGRVGNMLVESEVNMIAFTGSQQVGKAIMAKAASGLKRLVMELGGNDPMLVLADANLDAAAQYAVASSFENSGQMCTSTERVYVAQEVAELFEQKVVALAKRYRFGSWRDEAADIGPLVNNNQHQKVMTHINQAIDNGAKLLLGDANARAPYVPPTVLSDVNASMLIAQEETFGPVVAISRFSHLSEAISQANNTSYGLGAVVFGQAQAEQVAAQLQAGMIGINRGVGGGAEAPWVGAKQSGFGFHGGREGHRQFAQVTLVGQ